MTSTRLKELIKAVRQCKTAAEERAAIAKECANIRNEIRNEDNEFRQRNVAKLLYIHMLGYPTHFGQMECIKLIVSPYFSDKRIGYLGLMLLLDERQEVLMLVTNSLKNDLIHPNAYIVGLALASLGNISSASMARDLSPEVVKLLGSPNPYVRKKAALCAIRIIRKVPELMENFAPKIRHLLSERNHGVLLTAISLVIELCELDSENIDQFRRIAPTLVRIVKSLVLPPFSPEYDVSGVTDPFLQVKALKLLRILGRGSAETSDVMNDILAQVATNTEGVRNVGNAILYECVQTIMAIESESGLRVLAINILGRFLLNRDNNIRYVALNTLSKVISADHLAVQRHSNTIVDCLKDPDISIRRRALDLVYALVNETNIRILVRELLNFLVASDKEFRADLTAKICLVTEKYAPNKRWYIETILRVMAIADEYVPDQVSSSMIAIISQHADLPSFAVHRIFAEVVANIQQQHLVQLGVWCIGEYGEILLQDCPEDSDLKAQTPDSVIDVLRDVLAHASTAKITKDYVLTSLLKLSDRLGQGPMNRITALLAKYNTHIDLELQQRSCEYQNILQTLDSSKRSEVIAKMPPLEEAAEQQMEESTLTSASSTTTSSAAPVAAAPVDDLLADLMGGGPISAPVVASTPAAPAAAPAAPETDLLSDLLGGPAPSSSGAPSASPSSLLMDLMSSPAPAPAPVAAPVVTGVLTPQGASFPSMVVFQKNGLTVKFDFAKQPDNPSIGLITVSSTNATTVPLTNYVFRAAVPKYIQIQLNTPTSNSVPPGNSGYVMQKIRVVNSLHGQKPIVMKLRLEYFNSGQTVVEQVDVNNFPQGF